MDQSDFRAKYGDLGIGFTQNKQALNCPVWYHMSGTARDNSFRLSKAEEEPGRFKCQTMSSRGKLHQFTVLVYSFCFPPVVYSLSVCSPVNGHMFQIYIHDLATPTYAHRTPLKDSTSCFIAANPNQSDIAPLWLFFAKYSMDCLSDMSGWKKYVPCTILKEEEGVSYTHNRSSLKPYIRKGWRQPFPTYTKQRKNMGDASVERCCRETPANYTSSRGSYSFRFPSIRFVEALLPTSQCVVVRKYVHVSYFYSWPCKDQCTYTSRHERNQRHVT